jgi:hypothetical protein
MYIHAEDPWMMVFDNVDDGSVLQNFWPSGGSGHIIVTSRSPYAADASRSMSIQVSPLNATESRELFYRIVGSHREVDHNQEMDDLLAEWQGVPLALNHIGRYINRLHLDLPRFVTMYANNYKRIHYMRHTDEYPHSIATAFTIQHLDQSSKALLQAFCFFDPNSIPEDLIPSSIDKGNAFNTIIDHIESVLFFSLFAIQT